MNCECFFPHSFKRSRLSGFCGKDYTSCTKSCYTIKQIVSVLALANQLIAQFGTDETEQQCEHNFCPEIVNKIDGHIDIITGLVCGAVCKEYVGKQQYFFSKRHLNVNL